MTLDVFSRTVAELSYILVLEVASIVLEQPNVKTCFEASTIGAVQIAASAFVPFKHDCDRHTWRFKSFNHVVV